ncbi:DNA-directed RNA polymerase III subunit RPC3 isoform X2 [Hemiscyllium ocellatum]|uniref:DNA-directed RNA polymerase III subunit RPC3 isoform X2 n=1 Tax=Hemiscyllium ocellatum TaxID=170820 RepID=UPI00296610F3|nr:DNA-directed RNA polymerase III subunit RPC3 isoform X2 [Hemiscyllium ocellatum]
MTHFETQICSCLLQAHYGEIVAKVGTHLICTGCQPLRLIANDTETPIDQVKKALCVLIHHNFASYHVHKRGFVEYEVHCAHIIRILRYPRYIYSAKTLYGDTGELIVEELLQNGKMTMSTVVKKVADRLRETMEDNKTREHSETSNTFVRLVQTHFLQKCGLVSESVTAEGSQLSRAPTLITDEKEMYTVPNLSVGAQGKRRRMSEDGTEPKSKRSKPEHSDQETSSEIVRTMLRMSEVTTSSSSSHTQPLSSNEIFRAFPPGYNLSKPVLDQYLTLLSDDPMEFVGKSGDSGGGMFVINLHRALASLARATVESVVQERFGSRSARIFRLLLRKRHLEQKQVEDFAMIPAKEAKEMMYRMLSENYISLQEIPKTPDHAPSRTFYLYTVNLLPTARMILQRCYKTVVNLINRREYETRENKRLLEKSQRIEAIMASMQATGAEEQQLQEIEEMITAPEQQQLETLKHNVNMLDSSENQVDETIFILESYINTTRIEKEVPSKR